MTQQTPPRQRLADLLLDQPVVQFIAERREAGDSYRSIALALRDATGGEVDVTDVTVRTWSLRTLADTAGAAAATA